MRDEPRYRGHGGRANIVDVAERAGVSPATVSRSLRGIAKVSADTRRRVLDAARELDYVSLLEASSIEAGPRRSVAVIVPYITRWFFSAVTAGAVDYLRTEGFDVTLYHLGSAEVRDRFFERMPLDPRAAGILTLSMPLTEEHTLALRAIDLPLVSVGTRVPGSPSVGIDEAAAARSAVDHLLHLGHERIGMIAGRPDERGFDFVSSAGRREGASAALEAVGLRLDQALVAEGPHGPEGGAAAMAELLSRPVLPTAVFAEYDELAIGALWALRRSGLAVPGDVSVIGVDDHEMAAMLDLTTVGQSVPEQGEVAAQLLLGLLDGPPAEGVSTNHDGAANDDAPVMLPTRLVLRGTTAPPAVRRVVEHGPRRRGRSRPAR